MTLKLVGFAGLILVAMSALCAAQTSVVVAVPAPQFDVVTIKPTPPDTTNWRVEFNPGTMRIENRSLFQLVKFAYELKSDSQILSLPDWARTERFDITGKEDETLVKQMQALPPLEYRALTRELVRGMLQDRFHLEAHSTSVERPVFSLTVAKSGAKVKPSDPADGRTFRGMLGPNGRVDARGASMLFLADRISGLPEARGRVVVDNTGMAGEYDWSLRWTPESSGATRGGSSDPSTDAAEAAPSLFTALEEQLGLKLVSQKGTINALVVDRVERPTAN